MARIKSKMAIEEAHQLLSKKEVSPVDLVKESLEQIKQHDKELNSFISIYEEEAIEEAKQAEEEIQKNGIRSYLHGIPIALKDLIHAKGTRTTFGAERYKGSISDFDAEIVKKLKDAGAISIGKTNLHQYALGPTGDRSYFGPSRNPYNTTKITGGSSGGSASAVAGNLVYGAIGSDTGGSIRIPASLCGLVGMKPTFGLVSKHGAMVLSWTLDHLGPMTQTVIGNAMMLNEITGFDPKDPFSVKSTQVDYTKGISDGIKGKRIGIPTNFYTEIIDPEVKKVYEDRVKDLQQLGAEIIEVEIKHSEDILLAQQIVITTESFTSLEKELREAPEMVDSEVIERLYSGMTIQASDYINALRIKHLAIETYKGVLQKVDVLMTPTVATTAIDIEQRELEVGGIKQNPLIYPRTTGPSNTTGFPAISVNGGFSNDGLPIGIQFIGLPFSESKLYKFAYEIEQISSK